ncbi:hypothetical protein GCM10009076_15100 [Erythrobacter ramosus]
MLTPKGISQQAVMMAEFLVRKRAEYEALKEEIDALSLELVSDPVSDGTK